MGVMEAIKEKARAAKRRVALPEGTEERILKAAQAAVAERLVTPILLGDENAIRGRASELGVALAGIEIHDMARSPVREKLAAKLSELRRDKGVDIARAQRLLDDKNCYGVMLVKDGHADAMVSGCTCPTADVLRPALQILKTEPGVSRVSGAFVMVSERKELGDDGITLFADCAVNPVLTPRELAEVAISSARTLKRLLGLEPRVAMLSFSTKGSASHDVVEKVIEATRLAREIDPGLIIDGELQADAALIAAVGAKKAPGSPVAGRANVLVFPSLDAGNIGYKIAQRFGGCEAIGPILQGLNAAVNDLSRGATVADIVGTIAVAAVQAG
ncbi:MAG: phosphate acetyltransferase [Candidatus Wallbacteria bacterium]|nr:phosphate acetyltransferase [Candidatus Wallbacteria bacterium]